MEGLKDTLQAFKEFKRENIAKHIGEITGWHVTIAAEGDNLMFLLLLDREKYGC
jgi:bisphosphoglycerate-dependent phosphoglycerate mutase